MWRGLRGSSKEVRDGQGGLRRAGGGAEDGGQ